MKHKLFFILLQALVMLCGTAKANEITIGDGTWGSNDVPYGNYYCYSTTQSVYTASEIGQAGLIQSIAFDVKNASSLYMSNVKIYMGHKSSTCFSGYSDYLRYSEMTQVYSGSLTVGNAVGWEQIQLQGGFMYDGTNNLVVVICHTSSSNNGSLSYKYTSTSNCQCLYRMSNSSSSYADASSTSYSYSTSYSRPNIRLEMKNVTPMEDTVAEAFVTVGSENSYNGTYILPYELACNNGSTESIYLPSEIGRAGSISSISYYVKEACSNSADSIRVYMGHRAKGYFSSESGNQYYCVSDRAQNSDLTLVYSGNPGAVAYKKGWETIKLQNEFYYDGASNLVVVVCRKGSCYNTNAKYACLENKGTYYTIFVGSDSDDSAFYPMKDHGFSMSGYAKPVTKFGMSDFTSESFTVGQLKYKNTSRNTCVVTDGTSASGVVTIPASVTYNGNKYNVKSIEEKAFYSNNNIKEVILADGIEHIGDYAFAYSSLEKLDIPASVLSLGEAAFMSCYSLSYINTETAKNSLQLGEYCFQEIGQAKGADLSIQRPLAYTSTSQYSNYLFMSAIIKNLAINDGSTSTFSCFKNKNWNVNCLSLGENVTTIPDDQFKNWTIKNLVIEDSNKALTIGKKTNSSSADYYYGAFKDCKIDTLYIGRNLTYTTRNYNSSYPGYGTPFENNTSLKSVTVGTNVTSLGDYLFYGCTSVTDLELRDGASTLSLGVSRSGSIFYDCPLEKVYVGRNMTCTNTSYRPFSNKKTIKYATISNNLTKIDDYLFSGCEGIASIAIPSNVTQIGQSAFYGIPCITELTIPSTLTSIGSSAFANCKNLRTLTISDSDNSLSMNQVFYGDTITSVYVGRTIENPSTYESSFGNYVEDVTLGNKVTSLCDKMFYNSGKLKSIVIPQSVSSIGKEAFYNSGIESLTIPNSVTSIGNNIMGYNSKLKSLRIEDGDESLTIGYSSLNNQNTGLFRSCDLLEDVYIGRNLDYTTQQVSISSEIYYGAPFEHSKVKSVEFGDKVTAIGDYAFYHSRSLKTVILGENVNTFNRPFDQSGLDTLYTKSTSAIPATNQLGSIYDSNSNIKKTIVYVPNGTASLYRSNYIDLGNGSQRYNSWKDYCIIIDKAETLVDVILDKPGQLASRIISQGTMPADVAKLKIKGEMNDTDWELLQPNNMKYLYYLDLSEVTNDSIPSLQFEKDRSYSSYYKGGDLMTVLLPTYLKRIGNYAFNKCLRLSNVSFPSTIEEIGACAFQGTPLKELNIPSRSTESFIDSCAFNACTTLEKVTIGNNWNIGTTAFNGCSQLATVTIGQNASIGKQAFVNTALTSLSLSSGTHIGEKAFYQASELESLKIPGGGTTVGDYAFYGLYNLSSFSMDNGVKSIGNYAFYSNNTTHKVTSVLSLPSSVEAIGNYAFYNWSQVAGLEFGDDTESVGDYAFYGLKAIETVELPLNLKSLGKNSFAYCTNLKEVELHSGIESIGQYPFDGCNAINTVTAHWETPVPCYFSNTVYSNAKLRIPRDCAGAYLLADGWKNFTTFEEFDDSEGSVANDKIAIVENVSSYWNGSTKVYSEITYTRNYSNTKWQSLYVPFTMRYEDWKDEYDIAYINSVRQYDNDNDGTIDETIMDVLQITGGELYPNMPYLIKAKTTGEKTITLQNAMLYQTEENSLECSTMLSTFTFTGTYSTIPAATLKENGYYAMGGGGLIMTNGTSNLKPFRWYMGITSRSPMYNTSTDNPSRISVHVIGEEDDMETSLYGVDREEELDDQIFNLNGQMMDASEPLTPGLYIKNGKKVIIR